MKEISKKRYKVLYKKLTVLAIRKSWHIPSIYFFFSESCLCQERFPGTKFELGTHHYSAVGCRKQQAQFFLKNCVCIREINDKYFLDVHRPGECKHYLKSKGGKNVNIKTKTK